MRERSARRRTATNSPSAAAAQKPKAKPKPKSRPSSSSSPSSARRKSTPRKPAAEKRKSPTAATPAPTPTPKKAKNEYVVAARPVVAYSPHNGARGRVGIKAFGCSPSTVKVKEAEADEEEVKPDDLDGKGDVAAAAARNGAAMICKCGAGRCRKIVFLWGRDAQV